MRAWYHTLPAGNSLVHSKGVPIHAAMTSFSGRLRATCASSSGYHLSPWASFEGGELYILVGWIIGIKRVKY